MHAGSHHGAGSRLRVFVIATVLSPLPTTESVRSRGRFATDQFNANEMHFLGCRELFIFSLSLSLSFSRFFLFLLALSPFLLRADVTKSAAANALRSGLSLENREEELLPRGESIPQSLWWTKGDCRNERGEDERRKQGRDTVEGEGWHWDIVGGGAP